MSSSSRVFVSVTAKLQCGSPVHAIASAAQRVRVQLEADVRQPRRRSVDVAAGTPVRTRFCWRVTRTSPPSSAASSAIRDQLVAGDEADVDGIRETSPSCFCGWTPR